MVNDAPTGREAGLTGWKPVPQADARLRLKRVFLRALVFSLTACAALAVVALLVGEFSELTARILVTLGALALHSAIAMACADSLEKLRWPKLSGAGLILFGLNFGLLMACLWLRGLDTSATGRAALTTGALLGYYILAIPAAALHEERRRPALAVFNLSVCVIALVMLLICIWAEPTDDPTFPKATGIAAIIAFALAHTCLLVRVPSGVGLQALLIGTCASMWTLAALASGMVVVEPEHEF
jgi:hypothetical protein